MKRPAGTELALQADDIALAQGGSLVVGALAGIWFGQVALAGYLNGKAEERDAIRAEQRSR